MKRRASDEDEDALVSVFNNPDLRDEIMQNADLRRNLRKTSTTFARPTCDIRVQELSSAPVKAECEQAILSTKSVDHLKGSLLCVLDFDHRRATVRTPVGDAFLRLHTLDTLDTLDCFFRRVTHVQVQIDAENCPCDDLAKLMPVFRRATSIHLVVHRPWMLKSQLTLWSLLALLIRDSRSLTSIDLSNNELFGVDWLGRGTYTTDGITAIAGALSVRGSLTSINLSYNNIGGYYDDDEVIYTPEGAKAIADAIRVGSLTSINLQRNELGAAGAKELVKGGAFRGSLASINLSSNSLGSEGATELAPAIRDSGSLTDCTLLRNSFDVETATMLAKVSKEKKISLCGITPEQTKADFRDQRLRAADAILIAAALEFRGSLTSIDIGYNSIGKEQALNLVSIFKEKDQMKSIGLARCNLDVEGAIVVAEYVSVSDSLTYIDLRGNYIGHEASELLRKSVRRGLRLEL